MLTLVRYAVDAARSSFVIEARSSLHPIRARSTAVAGYLEFAWNADGSLALDPQPQVHVEIPVSSLASGNAAEDKAMREIAGSRSFPNVVADLTRLQPLDRPERYSARGQVSVRGTTRELAGEVTVRRLSAGVAVEGDATIDLRDFGITPPRILMFKVFPDVAIHLALEGSA
ncbi:MAG TPA: YceI family protein [Candidatus Acidoferrales bacterium]|nr:YceI family protein [Candidatus Acidoferrales bacterium]